MDRVPVIGDVVLYVLPDGPHAGESRPAFVVQVWSAGYVNLQVFIDGTNDDPHYNGSIWATSVERSDDMAPRSWHWPDGAR